MPKPGDVVAGKYLVNQLLGEGGMGAVFAATHRLTGKQVALKWMLPELARDEDAVHRFMREAQAAGRINHPNVVDVYDVGQHDDSFFLVMELLRGEALTSALSRRDLTVREVLDLLLRAMRGVAAAHRHGVIHRDLKPDNIFLAYEEDGVCREPKVLDFGISKVSNEGQLNPRLTRTGSVVGTPYYMSPEQIRGSEALDRRADVYAFGVILYEALTGQVPFIADTYGALVLEIATGTPKTPSDLVPGLPAELSQVVMRAMARNAQDRFADMESLIQALEPFLHDAPPPSAVTAPRPAARITANASVVSTPFTAEPAVEPPLGRPNPRNLLYVVGAAVLVGVVWFAIQQARSPELPVVTPSTVQAVQPPPAAPEPAMPTAPQPFDAPAAPALPAGVSTPAALDSAASAPGRPKRTAATSAGKARVSRPAPAPAAPDRKRARVEPPSAPRQPVAARPPPEPAAERANPEPRPTPPAAPFRRPRSGTLSLDEF